MHVKNTNARPIVQYNIYVNTAPDYDSPVLQRTEISFGDFFLKVMENKKQLLAPSSYQNYLVVYKHFQALIQLPLYSITGQMLDEQLDLLDISPESRKTYIRILSAIFNMARRKKLLAENPCQDMRQQKKHHRKVDLELPSDADIQSYLSTAKKEENYFMYKLILLAVATGMRLGELLNLSKDNLSLTDNTIQVVHQLTASGANMPLKTVYSYRRIYVAKHVLSQLVEYSPGHYIFTPKTLPEKQIARQTADKYIRKFFSQIANKPSGFCFHMLRHYHATKLLNRGIDLKEVSKRLGHASIATTGDMYTHWQADMDLRAAEMFNEL